jgi:drug/metabolite transporter (DMT)-like permease
VLAVILALASAVGYGGSDFAAGIASRAASVIQVTLLASAAATVAVAVALPLAASHPPTATALGWGAAAGLGGVGGAFALYLGFRHAAFSVAGPLSAVGAAGFSVLAGLLLGERPSGLALTGIILALPAIVGVSASAGGTAAISPAQAGVAGAGTAEGGTAEGSTAEGSTAEGSTAEGGTVQAGGAGVPASAATARARPAAGVGAGLIAGACFAVLFIGLNRAGSGSGLWPVAAAEAAEVASAAIVAVVTGNFRLPGTRPGWLAVVTGGAGATGTILYFLATHHGFLAVTAVLTSLYPAITIVLARTLLGERLTRLRLTGLALAAACVALIAAGGAG